MIQYLTALLKEEVEKKSHFVRFLHLSSTYLHVRPLLFSISGQLLSISFRVLSPYPSLILAFAVLLSVHLFPFLCHPLTMDNLYYFSVALSFLLYYYVLTSFFSQSSISFSLPLLVLHVCEELLLYFFTVVGL